MLCKVGNVNVLLLFTLLVSGPEKALLFMINKTVSNNNCPHNYFLGRLRKVYWLQIFKVHFFHNIGSHIQIVTNGYDDHVLIEFNFFY